MTDDLSDILGGVNLDEVDTSERGGFTPLPAGEYMVQIVEGEVVRKDSGDAGTGNRLDVRSSLGAGALEP